MGVKFLLIIWVKILFPLLQVMGNGAPHPCPPQNPNCDPVKAPITEGIILLLLGAVGLGIKAFSKKDKK